MFKRQKLTKDQHCFYLNYIGEILSKNTKFTLKKKFRAYTLQAKMLKENYKSLRTLQNKKNMNYNFSRGGLKKDSSTKI
jgi:hypothetical protein